MVYGKRGVTKWLNRKRSNIVGIRNVKNGYQ
jgi:hypothetical protein